MDKTLLDKAKITITGKITNTAILLLGKEESTHYISPSISEITWKVLFQFAKELNERGNTKKSKEYANYAKSLLQLNNNNLRDEKLKNFYLNEPNRSITIKELSKIL